MIRDEKYGQGIEKLASTLVLVFLWCLAIFLVSGVYMLMTEPLAEHSMPLFYLILVMHVGMILNTVKKLKLFEQISFNAKSINYGAVIKYSLLGFLFGISCCVIVLILYVFLVVVYGMSDVANRPLYGAGWIIRLGIVTMFIICLTYMISGIKEGIKYGCQVH